MMRKLYPVFFFAAATVLVFWKVIFHEEFTLLVGGDMASSYYPWFEVASYWLKRGVFMLWDPYVYAGKVNMGEPQPGIFYPLNWLFMLLPSKGSGVSLGGLQALLILDYFLAGLFTYLLARSMGMSGAGAALAGLAFAYGGQVAHLYGYVNVLSGFVWMPLALVFFRRALSAATWTSRLRGVAGAGSCLALAFLPGHHVPALHTGFLLLLVAAFVLVTRGTPRLSDALRVSLLLGLTALTSLSLTVFQWLPSAQWARTVFRWVGMGPPVRWGESVPYSILQQTSNASPQDALSLVLPYVTTGANLYTGGLVIFLALVALLFVRKREAWFLGFTAILYFFLSLGRFSVLHGWVNTFVPGLWFARELFYYLVPMQLCIALLAGWGLDCIVEGPGTAADRVFEGFLRKASWCLAVLVLGSAALIAFLFLHQRLPMAHPFITAVAGLASHLFVLGLLLFYFKRGRIGPRVFASSLVLLVLVDLGSHLAIDIRTKSSPPGEKNTYVRAFWSMPAPAERLKAMRQAEYFRVDDPSGIFPPNYGDAWRLDATMGHGATALVDYFDFRGTGWEPASNASALLNVAYFPSRTEVTGMERLGGEGVAIYRNPRAVPRAFVPSRFRCFSKREELLSWLASPLFDPRGTVLLDCADLGTLPLEYRAPEWRDDDGVEVRLTHRRTAGDQAAAGLAEDKRPEFAKYQPPPGWSVGDELSFELDPSQETRFFLVVGYRPVRGAASRLRLLLEGAGEKREIYADLPGSVAEGPGQWLRASADLGILRRFPYKLSLKKDERCTALLDSFRVARSVFPPDQEQAGTVRVTSLRPNVVRLKAQLRRPGFVVLSEVNYPGWEARVDGKPAPLLTGDYILRTLPVPAGEHDIELTFRPAAFRWGLVLSLLFLAAMLAFLACGRSSKPSRLDPFQ